MNIKYFLFLGLFIGFGKVNGQAVPDILEYKPNGFDLPNWMYKKKRGSADSTEPELLKTYNDFNLWRYEVDNYKIGFKAGVFGTALVAATEEGEVIDITFLSLYFFDRTGIEVSREFVFHPQNLIEFIIYTDKKRTDSDVIISGREIDFIKVEPDGNLEKKYFGDSLFKQIDLMPYILDINKEYKKMKKVKKKKWEVAEISSEDGEIEAFYKGDVISKITFFKKENGEKRKLEAYYRYGQLMFVYESIDGKQKDESLYYFYNDRMIHWLSGKEKVNMAIDSTDFLFKESEIKFLTDKYYTQFSQMIQGEI